MSYSYKGLKHRIFIEANQCMFLSIRDRTKRLMEVAGAATMGKLIAGETGDSWDMMACVDRLVELGEIVELTKPGSTFGQHRVFIPSRGGP